jgi:hypothetical protein
MASRDRRKPGIAGSDVRRQRRVFSSTMRSGEAVSMSQHVGWEFGGAEWCAYAADLGVKMIEAAKLDLTQYEWGFSECYEHAPERILAGRSEAAYHFMISGGKVTGGVGVPPECLALEGFHVRIPWAAIAHASSFEYGREGQRQRSADEAVMWREIQAETGRTISPLLKPPVWPKGIGEALSVNSEQGGGLHNLTAKRLKPSAEVSGLPQTRWGVPVLGRMSPTQKVEFIRLLGF